MLVGWELLVHFHLLDQHSLSLKCNQEKCAVSETISDHPIAYPSWFVDWVGRGGLHVWDQ